MEDQYRERPVEEVEDIASQAVALSIDLQKTDAIKKAHPLLRMLATRAANAHNAVRIMTREGYNAEAWVLMRMVSELAIDGRYILTRDTKARLIEFVDGSIASERRNLDELGKARGGPPAIERSRELAKFAKSSPRKYPPKYAPWKSVSIEQRAKEAGLHWVYVAAYSYGSLVAHTSFEQLRLACVGETLESAHPRVGPHPPDAKPLFFANASHLWLIDKYAEHYKLPDVRKRAAALSQR